MNMIIHENDEDEYDDDYDCDDDDDSLLVWWAGTERICSYVDSDSPRRDLKLRQMLMTCGKLSNQAPAVKSRLNGSCNSSAQ